MITDRKVDVTGREYPIFKGKSADVMNLVVNHGVDPETALTVVKGQKPPESTVRAVRDKARKYALTTPKMVKLAHKAVEDTLDMKPITYQASKPLAGIGVVDYEETIMPTVSNRLAAAAMVLDRDQPLIHKSVNLTGQVSISPVDLLEYMGSDKKQ